MKNFTKLAIVAVVLLLHTMGLRAQTIFGVVKDAQTGEALSEANIYTSGNSLNATTSGNGKFEIDVNGKQNLEITISYVGYSSLKQTISDITEDVTITFKLHTSMTYINEVFVVGNAETDPAQVIIINDYEKSISQPRNVADLFGNANGMSLVKRGNYAIDPAFRSFKYEQLNVQYDGGTKAMHACPNRMDPITTHVIPEEVEKVEIIKGPFSVRYGATMGGIINIISNSKTLTKNYGLHGHVSGGYEGNGNSVTSNLLLKHASSKHDVSLSGGFRDFGNYKDGSGEEIPSSFKSYDYGIKLGYNIDANQRLQAMWRQSFGRDVLHAGLPMDTRTDNSSIASLDYKLRRPDSKFAAMSLKAYYSFVDHVMANDGRKNNKIVDAVSSPVATTIGGKMELTFLPSDRWKLFTGIDYIHVGREGERVRTIKRNPMNPTQIFDPPKVAVDKVWQNSLINDLGIFVEGNYRVSEKVMLIPGLRYDMVYSNIKDPDQNFIDMYSDLGSRTEGNISGNISVKYFPKSNLELQVALGRGVRSANMIEKFINHFTIGLDPYEYVGNPNLKAEANHQISVSLKGKKAMSSGIDNISYGVDVYYSNITNYITAKVETSLGRRFMPMAKPSHPKVYYNIDAATKRGFEVFGEVTFLRDFSFNTSLAYVIAEDKNTNNPLPLVPPLTGHLKLKYEKDKYWADLRVNLSAEQDKINTEFGETITPGYNIFDIRAGIVPMKNMTFGVAITNLFDETYYDHLNFSFRNSGEGKTGPVYDRGRNFSAFLQYKF